MKHKTHARNKLMFSRSQERCVMQILCKYNLRSNSIIFTTGFSKSFKYNGKTKNKTLYSQYQDGCITTIICAANIDTGNVTISTTKFAKQQSWKGGAATNPECSQYLGVVIGEALLAKVFTGFKRMPYGNKGFDYICGQGYKIDAKTACISKHHPNAWVFNIRRNKVPDYFLCLAFDNREDLNPEHVWLIPGCDINHKTAILISKSMISKWGQYELSTELGNTIKCCNAMR